MLPIWTICPNGIFRWRARYAMLKIISPLNVIQIGSVPFPAHVTPHWTVNFIFGGRKKPNKKIRNFACLISLILCTYDCRTKIYRTGVGLQTLLQHISSIYFTLNSYLGRKSLKPEDTQFWSNGILFCINMEYSILPKLTIPFWQSLTYYAYYAFLSINELRF